MIGYMISFACDILLCLFGHLSTTACTLVFGVSSIMCAALVLLLEILVVSGAINSLSNTDLFYLSKAL
jgi:hypothetical protein